MLIVVYFRDLKKFDKKIGINYKNNNLNCIHIGGFFAGSASAIKTAYENFYNLHDEWMDKGIFIGKDQLIMGEMAFVRNKNSIARLRTTNLNCSIKYNRWFFYQYYLARDNEYICSENRLSIIYL